MWLQTKGCKKCTQNEKQRRLEMVVVITMWNEGNVVNLERLVSRAIDHFVIQWGDCNLHNPFFGVTSN